MKTSLQNPKIMVFKGSLEFYSSLDEVQDNYNNLIQNEKKYMKRIVEKISKFAPDLVFVEQKVKYINISYKF